MNRRDFLKGAGLTFGAFGLGSVWQARLARAATAQDRYYVFCYFEGGWDHLLGLDPRDPATFTDVLAAETGIEPGFGRLPADVPHTLLNAGPYTVGPCAHELAEVAGDVSIVRGINMATLTHEVGRRYFITGRPPAGLRARGSSVASLATAQLGGDRPVPHLAHRVESYAEALPSYAGAMQVASVEHVRFILQENLGIPTAIRQSVKDALAAYYERKASCDPGVGAGGAAAAELYRENRARARDLVKSGLYTSFELDSPALAPVREHYGFTAQQPNNAYGRAALASQALKSGLSRVVSVLLAENLDTHGQEWANDHSRNLQAGFNAFARLIKDLKATPAPEGGSLLSKTTIVAFSEFGRTARLNERNGRDHNLTNCALVAGAGIHGGRVIGSSSDNGLGPNLIDLSTGQSSEQGESLKPEHVMSTVLAAAGLDAADLRSEPIAALLA